MSRSVGATVKRRKELIVFACALVIGMGIVASSISGWLTKEEWGAPITVRQVRNDAGPAGPVLPDFSQVWEDGGRNPFGDAAVALESGGKARIPLPPVPPLLPGMPPPPQVCPIDFLTESEQ